MNTAFYYIAEYQLLPDAGNSYKCYPVVIQHYTNFCISFLSTVCPRNFFT